MTSPRRIPIFDGHNDVLLRLYRRSGTDAPRVFLQGEAEGHLDLPMAQQGGFAGGLFAIFVPSTNGASGPNGEHLPKASVTTPCWRLRLNWCQRKRLYSAWCLFFSVSRGSHRAAFASVAMSMIFNKA